MNIKINNAWKYLIMLSLTSVIILLPSFSFAQGQMFTPNQQDISLNILSQMFGDLVGIASGSSDGSPYVKDGMWLGSGLDPFQAVLRFFNVVCLTVGALLAMYSMVKGMLDTAHEGVFLGKDLNNPAFWIRNGAGIALILPVFKGYCILQVIVMWLIIQSVGIADTTWKAWFGVEDDYMSNNKDQYDGNVNSLYSLKMPSPDVASITYKAFEGYSCLYGVASEKIQDQISGKERTHIDQYNNNVIVQEEASKEAENGFSGKPLVTSIGSDIELGGQQLYAGEMKTEKESFNKAVEYKQKFAKDKEESLDKMMDSERSRAVANLSTFATPYINATEATFASGVIRFGAGNPNDSTSENNSACGMLNFTESGTPSDFANIAKVVKNSGGNKNPDEKKYEGKSVDQKVDFVNKIRERKNKESNEKKILNIYKNIYEKYHGNIRSIAEDYVNEINREVRFVEKKPDIEKQVELINSIRIKYIQKVDEIAHKFEIDVIKGVQKNHSKDQQEMNKIFDKQNGSGSVTGMTSNNKGTYVDFMTLARKNAETDGWALAGMWYMTITNSVQQMHDLMNISPGIKYVEQPDAPKINALLGYLPNSPNVNAYQSILDYYGFNNEHSSVSTIKGIRFKNVPPTDTNHAFSALGMGLDLDNLTDTGRHPIIILTESGHNLIDTAQKYMKYSSYWQQKNKKMVQVEKDKKPVPDPNDPSSQAHVMVSYFMGAIMVLGFMMAYYIPALPFLIWIGAMLGWIISVVEAIFIAPLWGAMHLHPEGSKYTGKGNAGYALLTSLLLRPTLMILGLIASLVIIQVFGMTVNYIFSIGMSFSLQNDGGTNNMEMSKLMYIIAVYAIYAIFMTGLITKMFNIITIIPDHILKWIGSQNGNLSEYGAIGGNETYGKLNALGGTAGNAYANKLKGEGEAAGINDRTVGNTSSLNSMVNGGNSDGNSATTNAGNNVGSSGSASPRNSQAFSSSGSVNNSGSDNAQNFEEVRGGNNDYNKPLEFDSANTTQVGRPANDGERAAHTKAYNNAYKISQDSSMSPQEGQRVSSVFADSSYKDEGTQNVLQDYAKDRPEGVPNIGERGDPGYVANEMKRIAEEQRANPDRSPSAMGQSLVNAIKPLARS